jgi:hypothetical protein
MDADTSKKNTFPAQLREVKSDSEEMMGESDDEAEVTRKQKHLWKVRFISPVLFQKWTGDSKQRLWHPKRVH